MDQLPLDEERLAHRLGTTSLTNNTPGRTPYRTKQKTRRGSMTEVKSFDSKLLMPSLSSEDELDFGDGEPAQGFDKLKSSAPTRSTPHTVKTNQLPPPALPVSTFKEAEQARIEAARKRAATAKLAEQKLIAEQRQRQQAKEDKRAKLLEKAKVVAEAKARAEALEKELQDEKQSEKDKLRTEYDKLQAQSKALSKAKAQYNAKLMALDKAKAEVDDDSYASIDRSNGHQDDDIPLKTTVTEGQFTTPGEEVVTANIIVREGATMMMMDL